MRQKRLIALCLGCLLPGAAWADSVTFTTAYPVGETVTIGAGCESGVPSVTWQDGTTEALPATGTPSEIRLKSQTFTINAGEGRLTSVYAPNAGLTALDLTDAPHLEALVCPHNQLERLNLNSAERLTTLDVQDNAIQSLAIQRTYDELTTLNCAYNQLSTLPLGNKPKLTTLICAGNALSTLTLTNLTKLTTLWCQDNALKRLNLSPTTSLEQLYAFNNELTLIESTKTWDLSDATIFSGEMKVTQVKDQLRFIVSEENPILLEDGLLKFTAAGDVDRAGTPTAGGLEFIVDKPGSVYIKTADYDDVTGNHVVVSLAGTVKGGAATNVNMGNAQKIIITDIAEETSVFLYASGPIAIESLAWSNDTTQVNTALPAPENITLSPASMIQGQATDIVISWDEVENAGSYSVSFNNATSETVTETSFTVPGSQTAFLQPGSVSVRVFANPAEGDIYNTQSSAGYAALAVLSSGGQGGGTTVSNAADLGNALAAGATNVTLEAGTYDFSTISASGFDGGTYTITNDLQLSAAGDATIIGAFSLGAGAGEVVLEGLVINGNGSNTSLFSPEDGSAVQSITVRNCDITGYTRSLVNGEASYGDIEFSGNLIHGFGADGGGGIDIRGGSISNLTFINNTLYDGIRDMFRLDEPVTGLNSVTISNNTFSNITGGNSNGFARIRTSAAAGITIANNIFLNMKSSNYSFVHNNTVSANTVNVEGNFFYDCHEDWFSQMDEATATANGGAVLTADPVADAANGDFTVTDATVKAAGAGEGRWL